MPNVRQVCAVPRGHSPHRDAARRGARVQRRFRRARRDSRPGHGCARHRRLCHRLACGRSAPCGPRFVQRRVRKPRQAGKMSRRHRADGAVRNAVPGARERAGLHRACGLGRLRRGNRHGSQGQPVPHGVRVRVRASVREALPPHAHRCSDQHSRHQEVRGRPARRKSGANTCPRRVHGQEGRHRGWRPFWPDLRILLRPYGT